MMPPMPIQWWRPPTSVCTRWPNSWKNVTTSSCVISPGSPGWPPGRLQTSAASGIWRPATPVRIGNSAAWLYLFGPRVHVEIEAAEQRRRAVLEHLVRFDRRIPDRRVLRAPVGDAEQPARHVEQSLLHAVEREVRPHRLRVEVVVGLAHQLAVVRAFPGVHDRRARHVLLLALEQRRVLALGLGAGRRDDASMNCDAFAALPTILSAVM